MAWITWTSGTSAAATVSTTATWNAWTTNGTTAVSVTYDGVTTAWNGWVTCPTTATTNTVGATVWTTWSDGATATIRQVYPSVAPPPAETEEERAARIERQRIEAEERARKAKEADDRAAALLQEHLSESQRDQYAKGRSFVVVAKSGNRYRLGARGSVEEIDAADKPIHGFCIHPTIGVPHPDGMLCKKLMLESNEALFLKTANKWRVAG